MLTAPDQHPEYLGRARFDALDGLRALSIVPVVWHHAWPTPLPGVWGKGPAGVALFFAISGFLITTLLLRERRDTGRVALPAFYVRRTLRIFPLYYLVLGAHAAWALALGAASPMGQHFLRNLAYHASYTANWFVDYGGTADLRHPVMFGFGWSLCTEEQFYLLWPPLLALLPGRWGPALAMTALVGLDLGVEHGALGTGWSALAVRIVTSFAAPIGLGSLLALALDHPRGFALAQPVLGRAASAPLALALVVVLLALDGVPLFVFDASLALLVGALVVAPRTPLAPALEHRATLHVGRVSYGIYLLHVPVLGALRRAWPGGDPHPALHFALALPLSIGAATLVHRWVERPFLALRPARPTRASA